MDEARALVADVLKTPAEPLRAATQSQVTGQAKTQGPEGARGGAALERGPPPELPS